MKKQLFARRTRRGDRRLHRRTLSRARANRQQPQQPPITFRAEVNYVEVDARVLDRDGKFVAGLTRGRLPGVRRRQAAEGVGVLDGQHPARARGAAAVCVQADRAGCAHQPAGRRRPHLRDRARRPAHRARCARSASSWRRSSSSSAMSAPTIWPRWSTPAAAPTRARNSPPASRALLRAVDKFMGRKLNSSTRNMMDDAQMRAGTPMAGDPVTGHRRQGARLQRARHARLDPQRRELPRQHPRPPQGGGDVQRRHRLQHQRDVQQHDHRSADRDRRDARHDRRGDARQRRDLRGRSARPRRRVRRHGVDPVVSRRHRRSVSACRRSSTRSAWRRTACA